MNTRVVLVDDHPMLRQGVRQALTQQPDMVLAGEASTGQAALQMMRELTPDLVVMDVHLPDISGLEASRRLLAQFPATKIIIFSADADRELVDAALQAGVCGYILKDTIPEELIRAIRLVMEGRLYLCPEVASSVVNEYMKMLASAPPSSQPPLTDRERQVLRGIAEGLQNKEIAGRLNVSPKSVEKSRARLMIKLGYRSVAELTRYAIREGIIPT